MIEIPWQRSNPDTEYYYHNNYVFKRRKLKDTTLYLIYDGEELQETTTDYFKFLRMYAEILNGGSARNERKR